MSVAAIYSLSNSSILIHKAFDSVTGGAETISTKKVRVVAVLYYDPYKQPWFYFQVI